MSYGSLDFWLTSYWWSASENANAKPAEDVLLAVILEAANLCFPLNGDQSPEVWTLIVLLVSMFCLSHLLACQHISVPLDMEGIKLSHLFA